MYYKCEQCKKVWYYPLDKCLFCHQPIEQVFPTKFTVQGISEVTVPSREHPKVPFFVLLLADEFGQMHTRKTFKSYSIGDEINEPSAVGLKNAVLVSKVKYSLQDAFERVGTMAGELPWQKDSKVAIKVSLKKAAAYNTGEVTDWHVVDLVLQRLFALGLQSKQIMLIERLPAELDEQKSLARSELGGLCQKHDIQFVNLTSEQHETIPQNGVLFDVPKILLGLDFLINITPLQINPASDNAPASYNLADLFPGQVSGNLDKLKADDGSILPSIMNIVDARLGLVRDEKANRQIQPKLLFMSDRAFALDRILCKVFGLDEARAVESASFELVGEELEVISTDIGRL